ncbi:MAG: ABC transporter permease, partial [Clostridiales bacterium]|nr:ABC transporter permease [Clostridiales bacterium]
MFSHIFKYRLKCYLRDRQMIFWTLLFPVVLATLFNLAFSNLSSMENFKKVEIAIVDNQEFQSNEYFKSAITTVSTKMFGVTYTDREGAEKLLESNMISGYIYLEDGIRLVVRHSGLNQTLIKAFLDDYLQTEKVISDIISKNPEVLKSKSFIAELSTRKDYLKEIPISRAAPNSTVIYFFALIAMACLYGSFWGIRIVTEAQADLSPQGARVNIAPIHKLKLLSADISA